MTELLRCRSSVVTGVLKFFASEASKSERSKCETWNKLVLFWKEIGKN